MPRGSAPYTTALIPFSDASKPATPSFLNVCSATEFFTSRTLAFSSRSAFRSSVVWMPERPFASTSTRLVWPLSFSASSSTIFRRSTLDIFQSVLIGSGLFRDRHHDAGAHRGRDRHVLDEDALHRVRTHRLHVVDERLDVRLQVRLAERQLADRRLHVA